jgi:hypothetical protein
MPSAGSEPRRVRHMQARPQTARKEDNVRWTGRLNCQCSRKPGIARKTGKAGAVASEEPSRISQITGIRSEPWGAAPTGLSGRWKADIPALACASCPGSRKGCHPGRTLEGYGCVRTLLHLPLDPLLFPPGH